jgi:hypothetical protein
MRFRKTRIPEIIFSWSARTRKVWISILQPPGKDIAVPLVHLLNRCDPVALTVWIIVTTLNETILALLVRFSIGVNGDKEFFYELLLRIVTA